MKSWTSDAKSLLLGLVLSVVVTFCALAVMAVFGDLRPAGPECTYSRPGASGPSGVGREEVSWSFLPDRVCVVDGSPPGGGADLSTLFIAGCIGIVAGGAGASLAERRFRRTSTRPPLKH